LDPEEAALKRPLEYEAWKSRDPNAKLSEGESLGNFYERVLASATKWANTYPD